MQSKNKTNLKHSKDDSHIQLPNDKIVACIDKASYVNLMQQADNVDVTINHLENIFTDENINYFTNENKFLKINNKKG